MNSPLTTLVLALALAIPCLGLPTDAPAQLASVPEDLARQSEEDQKAYWQGRYRRLVHDLEATRQQLADDRVTYSKGRQRGRLRGDSRDEVVTRISEGEKRVAELEKQVEEFPDEARRAGVPPGWLRDIH